MQLIISSCIKFEYYIHITNDHAKLSYNTIKSIKGNYGLVIH